MRVAFNLLCASAVLAANKTHPTLQEVYGAAPENTEMLPYYKKQLDRVGRPGGFYKRRTPENCTFSIDLVIAQDITSSFDDDLGHMVNTQIDLMLTGIMQAHPGSRVGVVTFRDKPIWSLGEPATDFCSHFDLPLTNGTEAVKAAYAKLRSVSGGDPPEAQFHALNALAQSSTPGWDDSSIASRLVVVATDAGPHFEGDGFNKYGLVPFPGAFDEVNAATQCTAYYYPTPAQVRSDLHHRELYSAFLIYDGGYMNGQPREAWKWFNNYIGQTPGFFRDLESDASDFWARLAEIISALEEIECGVETTVSPSVTPAGTVEVTTAAVITGSTECPPCPACPPTGTCDPCHRDGVLIKLRHRPRRMRLEVEN